MKELFIRWQAVCGVPVEKGAAIAMRFIVHSLGILLMYSEMDKVANSQSVVETYLPPITLELDHLAKNIFRVFEVISFLDWALHSESASEIADLKATIHKMMSKMAALKGKDSDSDTYSEYVHRDHFSNWHGIAEGSIGCSLIVISSPFQKGAEFGEPGGTVYLEHPPLYRLIKNDLFRREAESLVKPSKLKEVNNNEITDIHNEHVEKHKSTATRHLIFIRHGQYNLEGITDNDRYLTQLGREQAALTGERLKTLGFPYTKLVFSTMTRATETARIILEKLGETKDIEHCDLLREGAPIPPEPPIGSWKPEVHKFFTDGARIEAAFRKYVHRAPYTQEKDSYEIFVCHANVIRYIVCRALQLPPEAWLRMTLHNGSMTHIVIRPDGRVGLWHLGECGYMPPEKLSRT
ncbi:serine/threonine-protein phosphatase PGAM5, mitochondrial-like [Macrobrachium nipponense]|uniref:serine/threonine-protein phosphatase PGAM5, mitochondrial-like n=1 Tax=Macrobrachium nipponense TaxID=159736 RepID=UPI0030C7CD37